MTSKVVLVCLLIFLGKCWSINCVYDIPYVVNVLMNIERGVNILSIHEMSINMKMLFCDGIDADNVYNVNHEQ